MHFKSRSPHAKYPERYQVPDPKVEWDVPFPEYAPVYFVDASVLKNDDTQNNKGWADPENIELSKKRRPITSYESDIRFDSKGYPLNPKGRTGINGRGLLGRWGANYAADPIITRTNPETGQTEMIVIKRGDTGEWALPGGMVDKGEDVLMTLRRELSEETSADLSMTDAVDIYQGYVDDPRNTDNAWMETTAKHKHLSNSEADKIQLKAGDDAREARWMVLTDEAMDGLYADHGAWARIARSRLHKQD